jgi:CRP/FNR family transcriptional regulator, cyclic AMP receptor protein
MTVSTDDKAAALGRVPLFEGISDESMRRLTGVAGEVSFSDGQFIVRQGQVGTGLYVILRGAARVIKGSDELAELGEGDFFGELSVIDQQPRTASVQSVGGTTCLAVASWDLLDLLASDSALSLNLIRGLAQRIRSAGEHHRH